MISSGITLDKEFCCSDFFLDRMGLAFVVVTEVEAVAGAFGVFCAMFESVCLALFFEILFLITSDFKDNGLMVPCNFWKRPQALQRVFPSGLLLQSGVLKVLQLKHCIRGFLFCPDGSILDILEDTEAALLKLARDVDDIGLISEFFLTEFVVLDEDNPIESLFFRKGCWILLLLLLLLLVKFIADEDELLFCSL